MLHACMLVSAAQRQVVLLDLNMPALQAASRLFYQMVCLMLQLSQALLLVSRLTRLSHADVAFLQPQVEKCIRAPKKYLFAVCRED